MERRPRISEWQMATMMASAFTALGLFTYPRDLLEGAGRQAYWGLILAILLAVLSVVLIVRIGLIFPGQTPIEYTQTILGKPLGMLAGAWLVFYHVGLVALTVRYFADLVNTVFLARTPIEAIMLLLIVAAVLIVWNDLESIARFVALVFPVMLTLVAVTFTATFVRVTEMTALLPPVGFDPAMVLAGSWRMLYVFIGIEAVSMLLPYVREPKRPYRYALSALGANSTVLLLILLVTVGLWGVEPVIHLQYPGIAALRVLRPTGLLVERLGAFAAVMWTMIGLTFVCTRLWTVSTATAQLFGLGTRDGRYFLFPTVLLTFFLARWPLNSEELERYIHTLVVPLGMASNAAMTVGLMLIARARGLGAQR